VEYEYTHIRAAHLVCQSFWFSHYHQVENVEFRASVALVIMEVHLSLCASSESVDCFLYNFGE